MEPISLNDIRGLAAYEKIRDEFRRSIIDLKRIRRVSVGDNISLVFENRETVVFQIQEMMRAERITDLDKIREEIEAYGDLLPKPGELSATLFIEIEDQKQLRQDLLKFLGIDEAVFFRLGSRRVHALFEQGRSKEDKISAVQYVRFPFTADATAALASSEEAYLCIDHPNYKAEARLSPETRQSLMTDLQE